ncbi:DUF4129 domain-containing protein [Humibacter ginsenosidimutans]|uniref:DUF4129 domain-containing protein n=1 Tax=Humibacter ginsenosidimutans TaxID=2599293 RepID=UPI001FEF6BB7|nr:DUF4129 domain-containing protein [Humibacter ginsenosidimutans]
MVIVSPLAALLVSAGTPPLTPDGPTAQHWLRDELAKPEYQAAKPTWFDQVAKQIADWFASLGVHVSGNAGWVLAGIGIAIALALIIGAFAVFGLPRLRRAREAETVFDDGDARSVDDLRRDADAAAAAGRYADAVRDRFRAIARALGERTIVLLLPGTTSQELAVEAADALPAFDRRLHAAAGLFDAVRYLGHPATADDDESLAALDRELAVAKPQLSMALDASAGGAS